MATSKKKRNTLLPDRSVMEEFIATVGFKEAERLTSEAQFIMYDVWEAETAKESEKLAKKALKLSPLCADAYNFLGETLPPKRAPICVH